jgi:hypothetical protein
VEIVKHVTDDLLKRYAMKTLPDSETGPLEEHLLNLFGVPGSTPSCGRICGGDEGGGEDQGDRKK